MLQFPIVQTNKELQKQAEQILLLAKTLQVVPILPSVKPKVFHQQFLKSSLFSAKIEGNKLTLIEVENKVNLQGRQRERKEVNNLLRIMQKLPQLSLPKQKKQLQVLHKQIMNGITPDAGKVRSESSAIFDQFGNIVYLTPSPVELQKMLEVIFSEFKRQFDSQKLALQLCHIAACHYYFEKIHPFLDGNGRTGRVIMHLQFQKTNLFDQFILPIDEYFEKNKSEYYLHLDKNTRRLSSFYTFFLQGMIESLENILGDVKKITENELFLAQNQTQDTAQQRVNDNLQNLLPRRQEILAILQDHPFSSLDFLARRFPTLSQRTLAYDLQWLVTHQFVTKHGSTRGASYSTKNN